MEPPFRAQRPAGTAGQQWATESHRSVEEPPKEYKETIFLKLQELAVLIRGQRFENPCQLVLQ